MKQARLSDSDNSNGNCYRRCERGSCLSANWADRPEEEEVSEMLRGGENRKSQEVVA